MTMMHKLISANDNLYIVKKTIPSAKFDRVINRVSKADLCTFYDSEDVLRGNDGMMYFVNVIEDAILDE